MTVAPLRILVAEFFPAFNKGELAILSGMLKSFEVVGEVEVAVFSFYPEIDRTMYPRNVKLIDVNYNLHLKNLPYNQSKLYVQFATFFVALQHLVFLFLYGILRKNALRIMQKPLWKIYREYDVYIICTNEVDCVIGSTLRFSPLYICWLAKALKKPIVFYANGTNPSTSEIWIWRFHSRRLWRILARYLLSVVDLVTVREEHTLRYFNEITGGNVPIYLTADPAFLLSPASKKRIEEIMINEKISKGNNSLIGVAMSYGVLSRSFKGTIENPKATYERAVKEIARVLDKLIEELDSTIIFVPHSIEPYGYHDDRIVARDIYGFMLNKRGVQVIANEYSAEELKGLLGQLDLFVSCRVHAAISAVSMNTPVCIISHPSDERPYYILGKMLKLEKWIYNVENLNADELFCLVKELLTSSSRIRNQLPSLVDSVKKKAELNGRLLKSSINIYLSRNDFLGSNNL